MVEIIAVTNQKGGVGKTTTSVNLVASLAATQKKTLLIDLDPQGNATMGSGVNKAAVKRSIYDGLVDSVPLTDLVHSTDYGFTLLPANSDLTAAEVKLLDEIGREYKLKRLLEALIQVTLYDYVVIDCPPSLSMLTVNALTAADSVLIPIQCEYYALEGLVALLETVEKIKAFINPNLKIAGLLRTMFDPRNSLSNDVSKLLLKRFGSQVLRTVIPRNVRLAEAPSHGMPVIMYDKKSRGSISYLALAGELLRREEHQKQESFDGFPVVKETLS